jgi:hypothetical protein
VRKRRRTELGAWFKKLFVGALLWFAKKVLEPIPVLGAMAEIVSFAM